MLIDTEFSDKKKAALDDSGTAFFLYARHEHCLTGASPE